MCPGARRTHRGLTRRGLRPPSDASPQDRLRRRSRQSTDMAGEHILIVDDEPGIQATLRGVLEDEGYRVTAVGGGADALRVVADESPDLTFLDIWMERM